MISPAIRQETVIFLLAALHGIFLALWYDVLRGLRSAVPHDGFAVSIEDFFYWIIAGFLTFLMAFSVSEGGAGQASHRPCRHDRQPAIYRSRTEWR